MFDFENSSRSADSTEESVDIPSPKSEGDSTWKSPSFGVYHVDDISPTEDVPETESSDVEEEDVEVSCISAAAKKNLTPVEDTSDQPMSSSFLKYKADSSWIKEATEMDATSQSDSQQDDAEKSLNKHVNIMSAEVVDGDSPSIDVQNTEASDSNEMPPGGADNCEEMVVTPTDKVEVGVAQHYMKENIPWNLGIVKKQTQDIEEKAKETKSSVTSGDESSQVVILGGELLTESSDSLHDSESNVDTIYSQVGVSDKESKDVEMKIAEVDEQKRPTSVYDMEDIPLPVGIVRKTTKEIEERNK